MLVVVGRAIWGIALIFSTSAYGQAIPDPVNRDAERIQQREQERQRAREQEFRDAQSPPPSGAIAPVAPVETKDAGACVAIQTVNINGMERYARTVFDKELSSLIGDCIAVGDINNALRVITNRYVADGYVTSRAVVGPQDLNDGSLDITVFEGQVGDVISKPNGYGQGMLNMAFPGLKGKQLNLRDIEQGVDQLSRLAYAEPDIDIAPSDLPGASVIQVKQNNSGLRFRPGVLINNDGSQTTGRLQSTATLDLDSPFGRADYWSLYYSRDLQNDPFAGTRGFGGFVSIPYGYWTATFSGGHYKYKSVLSGNGQSFSNNGRSWNGSAALDRLLYRDAKTKIAVSVNLGLVDTENRIQGIRLSTSSYRQATVAIDWRVQRRVKEGLVSATVGFTRGLKILGANAVDTGPGGASIKFRKIDASISYQSRLAVFGVPLNYIGLLRGQTALDPIFPAQRFSLGGSSTVRGFRDDGISGRNGFFTRQQISFPLLNLFTKSKVATGVSGFIGYDAGGIIATGPDRFERGFLHSSTIGLRTQNKYLQFEMGASTPLSAPSFIKRSKVEVAASLRVGF